MTSSKSLTSKRYITMSNAQCPCCLVTSGSGVIVLGSYDEIDDPMNCISRTIEAKIWQKLYLAAILDAILNYKNCSRMPRWHSLDSFKYRVLGIILRRNIVIIPHLTPILGFSPTKKIVYQLAHNQTVDQMHRRSNRMGTWISECWDINTRCLVAYQHFCFKLTWIFPRTMSWILL